MLVTKLLKAKDDSGRKGENEEMKVQEESGPSSWLMFRDGGDDWNISAAGRGLAKQIESNIKVEQLFGIAGVP
jgi:hypothetical protein